MAKKLPRQIYVRWVEQANGEPFLTVEESWVDLADLDESRVVGVYTLDHTATVEAVPQLRDRTRAK